jgi:hypothetical protein
VLSDFKLFEYYIYIKANLNIISALKLISILYNIEISFKADIILKLALMQI